MSSYSCVTARLTMRSVLQTHWDSRSRSGPVIGLLPRPSLAPMLPVMPSTRKVFICIYIYIPCGGAVDFESSWRWPMSQEAEGARQTTQRDDYKRRPRCRFPACRLGTPKEIAKVVAFLPSDDRSYLTAAELFVEGGFVQV